MRKKGVRLRCKIELLITVAVAPRVVKLLAITCTVCVWVFCLPKMPVLMVLEATWL